MERLTPMSTNPKLPASKPPKSIKVDVKNPRYEGATFEMVVKALLQRPRKVEKPSRKDEPESGGAQSST